MSNLIDIQVFKHLIRERKKQALGRKTVFVASSNRKRKRKSPGLK